eukprot:gene11429-4596_t
MEEKTVEEKIQEFKNNFKPKYKERKMTTLEMDWGNEYSFSFNLDHLKTPKNISELYEFHKSIEFTTVDPSQYKYETTEFKNLKELSEVYCEKINTLFSGKSGHPLTVLQSQDGDIIFAFLENLNVDWKEIILSDITAFDDGSFYKCSVLILIGKENCVKIICHKAKHDPRSMKFTRIKF